MRVKDVIPQNILDAALRAGLRTPDWYVGRTRRDAPRRKTLEDLVREIDEKLRAEATAA